MSQSRQWLRKCSLVVGRDGQGLELGDLRVSFSVRKGFTQTPNSAEIRVYNLSKDTTNRIRREFTRVILQAGYPDNYGLIFDGTIIYARTGRDNGTDSWLEIQAADGDVAYNFAVVNTTLAAGSKPADRVAACQDAMAAKGASAGHVPDLGGQALPRGKVLWGNARTHLRAEAEATGTSWSIQDGVLQIVEQAGYLPGEAVVLTSHSGLIGVPEQCQDGIKVRCLLNPRLRVGGRIQLDNASIQGAKIDVLGLPSVLPSLDADGIYRVLSIDYRGDTRGNDWHADMVCIGLDDASRTPLDMARQ